MLPLFIQLIFNGWRFFHQPLLAHSISWWESFDAFELCVCECLSHATEFCYVMLTCAVHFTVLLFKVHDRMHSNVSFLSFPLFLCLSLTKIELTAYKGKLPTWFFAIFILHATKNRNVRMQTLEREKSPYRFFCFDYENWISDCDMSGVWHLNNIQ